jgi:hypothetical protein
MKSTTTPATQIAPTASINRASRRRDVSTAIAQHTFTTPKKANTGAMARAQIKGSAVTEVIPAARSSGMTHPYEARQTYNATPTRFAAANTADTGLTRHQRRVARAKPTGRVLGDADGVAENTCRLRENCGVRLTTWRSAANAPEGVRICR